MDNTWGFHNMKVTEPLRVQWKRDIVIQRVNIKRTGQEAFVGDYYALKYTRTRTKKWEYIGLTQEAAKVCVAQFNEYLNRIQIKQAIRLTAEGVPQFFFTASRDPRNWNRVNCGTVAARLVAGESYTVSIDLQEVLSYFSPYMTPVSNEDFIDFFERYKWFQFENYPSGEWPQFRGGDASDFSLIRDFDTFEKPDNTSLITLTRASYSPRYDGSAPYSVKFGVAGGAVMKYNKFLLKCYKHGTDEEVLNVIGFGGFLTRDGLLGGLQPYWNNNKEIRDLELVAYEVNRVVAVSSRVPIYYGE